MSDTDHDADICSSNLVIFKKVNLNKDKMTNLKRLESLIAVNALAEVPLAGISVGTIQSYINIVDVFGVPVVPSCCFYYVLRSCDLKLTFNYNYK